VLHQACAEAAAWPDDLKVAVNLSPVQLKKGNLPQVVFATLASAGLPAAADDRRHFVAWSDCGKEDFSPGYWDGLWGWYEAGGYAHAAAYLLGLDISSFDPKALPPKTPAFWDIADAGRAPEDAELADAIDKMGDPDAITLGQIKDAAIGRGNGAMSNIPTEFFTWICDRKNRRVIPHRLEKCGYVSVRNETDKSDGQWKVGGSRVTIYAKRRYH
jgi:hypothetical protein